MIPTETNPYESTQEIVDKASLLDLTRQVLSSATSRRQGYDVGLHDAKGPFGMGYGENGNRQGGNTFGRGWR